MTAKEYLRKAWELKQDIERKQNQVAELYDMAGRATGAYAALRIGGTASHSKLENAVIRLVAVGDELGELTAQYAEKYREIAAVIDAVGDPTYRQLLSLRYLSFKKWEEIAVKMNYCYMHVHRLHGEALQVVEKML